ncbi:PIN domain-containing protein [Terrarubrum flagellatum]|uniref:PIN domain-containing protein n=1 Tax=Terrirubrum flagellatum TaxID=2895980 RepID=UPI0031454607
MSRTFLDTNILLYSISRATNEAKKRARAIELIDAGDVALSTQVLQEFYVQATRSTRTDAIPHDVAAGLIRAWLRFPVQPIDASIVLDALAIKDANRLSYWDSAIIAAAKALSCETLYSEDLSHDQAIEGVRIVDPFL